MLGILPSFFNYWGRAALFIDKSIVIHDFLLILTYYI